MRCKAQHELELKQLKEAYVLENKKALDAMAEECKKQMRELQNALKQARYQYECQYEMAKEAKERTIKEVFERLEKENLVMTSGTYLTRPTICISKEQFEKLKKELLRGEK